MLQARMATRVAKPDGQFWLRPDDVAGFMLDKKVTDLPGFCTLAPVGNSVQCFVSVSWVGKEELV